MLHSVVQAVFLNVYYKIDGVARPFPLKSFNNHSYPEVYFTDAYVGEENDNYGNISNQNICEEWTNIQTH